MCDVVLAFRPKLRSVTFICVQPQPATPVPVFTALDCEGWTGIHGCGPGWFWRDGWRGWACYVC